MSSRTPAPVNLKERIAALEQRNAAQPPKQPSSSSSPSTLTPPASGNALRDRIAKFEKKGGVPVPRGSFGLGAPPPLENAPAKRRGELYGNRIPTPVLRSHHTGNGMMNSGLPPTSRPTSPLGYPVQNKRMSMSGLDLEKYGMDFSDNSEQNASGSFGESTGSFSPTPTPTSDIDSYLQVRQEAKANKLKSNFASAMDAAKKAEAEGKGMYHSREGSMSPETRRRFSRTLDEVSTPEILVYADDEESEPLVQEPAQFDTDSSQTNGTSTDVEQTLSSFAMQESVDDQLLDSGADSQPQSLEDGVVQSSQHDKMENHDVDVLASANLSNNDNENDVGVEASTNSGVEIEGEEIEEEETTPRASTLSAAYHPSIEPAVEVIESAPTSTELASSSSVGLVPQTTTSSVEESLPITPMPETPKSISTPSRLRESFMSSRPVSILDASPGHITFAQRIAPVAGRNIYIPAKVSTPASSGPVPSESQPISSTINTKPDASVPEHDEEGQLAQTDEFGVVTIGPVPSKHKQQISRSFSAVVHDKARETSSSTQPLPPVSAPIVKYNTLPSTPHRPRKQNNNKFETPMSPGFSDLAMLLETTALLEERLMQGEIPSEIGKMADVQAAQAVAEEMRALKQKQMEEDERVRKELEKTEMNNRERKKSTKSSKSVDTIRKKISFKNTIGRNRSTKGSRKESGGVESLPTSQPSTMKSTISNNLTSASTPELLDVEDIPKVDVTPPKSRKEKSVPHLPSTADEDSAQLTADADKSEISSIPPTPPPKSPRYFASLRRLASSGRTHAARLSMSLSSEPSSEDSMSVATPPDAGFEFGFSNSRRSGFIGPSGGGMPWPNQSPKKSGGSSIKSGNSIKGGIGKMWGRGRTKSGASSIEANDQLYKFSGIPELPSVVPSSPSLHEILLPSSADAHSIPTIQEPSELPYTSPSTPPPKIAPIITTNISPDSLNNSRASWMSTNSSSQSSSTAQSPLFDKEFFDSFPSVPQTTPLLAQAQAGRIPLDLDLRATSLFGGSSANGPNGREQANSPPIHA